MRRKADPYLSERMAMDALVRDLRALDEGTRAALASALARGEEHLAAGSWGSRGDGDGCLLSLAAWEMGLEHGEELMHRSVAAVRVPALFDELWTLVLQRTGVPAVARRVAYRLVLEALGEPAAASSTLLARR